MTSLHIKLM